MVCVGRNDRHGTRRGRRRITCRSAIRGLSGIEATATPAGHARPVNVSGRRIVRDRRRESHTLVRRKRPRHIRNLHDNRRIAAAAASQHDNAKHHQGEEDVFTVHARPPWVDFAG